MRDVDGDPGPAPLRTVGVIETVESIVGVTIQWNSNSNTSDLEAEVGLEPIE
jgi:hypothetical protein